MSYSQGQRFFFCQIKEDVLLSSYGLSLRYQHLFWGGQHLLYVFFTGGQQRMCLKAGKIVSFSERNTTPHLFWYCGNLIELVNFVIIKKIYILWQVFTYHSRKCTGVIDKMASGCIPFIYFSGSVWALCMLPWRTDIPTWNGAIVDVISFTCGSCHLCIYVSGVSML